MFASDASHFYIFDRSTGSCLYQGLCKDDLYKLLIVLQSLLTLSASLGSFSLWHCYFGHLSNKVMSYLGSNKLLSHMFKFKSSFCTRCTLEDAHISFFIYQYINTPFSFALVRFDVWKSSMLSVFIFKYYVLSIDGYTCLLFMRHKFEILYYLRISSPIFALYLAISTRSADSNLNPI